MTKKTTMMRALLLALPLAASSARAADWPRRDDLPPACDRAHAAYLARDFGALGDATVACLRDPTVTPLVAKNTLQTLQAAYLASRGRLPASFRLPEGLERLRLVHRRNEDQRRIDFVTEFIGKLARDGKPHEVSALKLEHADGEVVLDKADGAFEFRQDDDGFYLKRRSQDPLPEGLYKITIQLVGGERLEQWAPVVDWASDTSPAILAPQPGQTTDPNPELAWTPFTTGDRGYDWRGFWVDVVESDAPDYEWKDVWKLSGDEGDRTRYVVGREPNGGDATALAPGRRHIFSLTYMETRRFGQLVISKSSNARVAFRVR